jgi:molybdate/tungstate transport system substrate-binding protein
MTHRNVKEFPCLRVTHAARDIRSVTLSRRARPHLCAAILLLLLACGAPDAARSASDEERSTGAASAAPSEGATRRDTLVLYVAASLTTPLQPVIDTFVARTGAVVQRESGGSLEHARKVTELHRVPDLLLLADAEVIPRLLVPVHVSWYADFARNRMVVAYTPRSRHAGDISAANWRRILTRSDVAVGRTDPAIAPAGYRTLLMFRLAERHYHDPGLAERLLANAPARNVRPDPSQLAALLGAGELDYIYEYESVAASHGFRFLELPGAIDLGDPGRAIDYAAVSVRVRSSAGGDSITVLGKPILYGLTVPRQAPHPEAAARFAALVLGAEGQRLLREGHVDALSEPILHGDDAPSAVRAAVAR